MDVELQDFPKEDSKEEETDIVEKVLQAQKSASKWHMVNGHDFRICICKFCNG